MSGQFVLSQYVTNRNTLVKLWRNLVPAVKQLHSAEHIVDFVCNGGHIFLSREEKHSFGIYFLFKVLLKCIC